PDVAETLSDLLTADGYTVEVAGGGDAAMARLEHGGCDVIMSDIRMPGLDGGQLYEAVSRRWPELARRIVFITGDALSHDTGELLKQTGAPYIGKPLDLDEIRQAVKARL